MKGWHQRQIRTVFGRVTVRPRVRDCPCAGRRAGASFSPLTRVVPAHCDPARELGQGRHVNVVAGRACFEDDQSRVCAYVHNQVNSAAERLDGFLRASGVDPNARVTILTDGAGEFEKAAKGCAQPTCRILDWFHIAMKFEAAKTSVFGCKVIGSLEREAVRREIRGAKWLAWHGREPRPWRASRLWMRSFSGDRTTSSRGYGGIFAMSRATLRSHAGYLVN